MPAEFDDMITAMKKSLLGKENPRTGKPYTESDIFAIARVAYRKKYGKDPMGGETTKAWNVFEYSVPIEVVEAVKVEEGIADQPFLVRGVAINEGVTRNNVKYAADELRASTHTLVDKPILKDHNNTVDSIVGRTTQNVHFDETMKAVKFEGKIMERKYADMIRDGRITNVSIGASVKELVQEESEGSKWLVAKGLEFLELSLVPVPGCPQASIGQALEEAYHCKQAVDDALNILNAGGEGGEKMEEKNSAPPVQEGLDKVQTLIEQNTALVKELGELKKKVEEREVKKVETEETTKPKGLVEKPAVSEDYAKYVIEAEGRTGALWMMPNSDGTFPKRKKE